MKRKIVTIAVILALVNIATIAATAEETPVSTLKLKKPMIETLSSIKKAPSVSIKPTLVKTVKPPCTSIKTRAIKAIRLNIKPPIVVSMPPLLVKPPLNFKDKPKINRYNNMERVINCDLNGDGLVDSRDVKLLEAFYGKEKPYLTIVNNPDLNDNGIVDLSDLAAVLSAYGPCGKNCLEDLNGDQIVDDCDVKIVEAFYGGSCDLYHVRSPDLDGDGDVDLSDLAILLANMS